MRVSRLFTSLEGIAGRTAPDCRRVARYAWEHERMKPALEVDDVPQEVFLRGLDGAVPPRRERKGVDVRVARSLAPSDADRTPGRRKRSPDRPSVECGVVPTTGPSRGSHFIDFGRSPPVVFSGPSPNSRLGGRANRVGMQGPRDPVER